MPSIRRKHSIGMGACAADVRHVTAKIIVGTLPTETATAFRVVFRIAVGIGSGEGLVSFQRATDGDIRC